MVRVSVRYDESLKEQVFMVRGDEDYARSTATVLELVNAVEAEDMCNITLKVNVIRDRGDASIIIFDNDVAVYTIDDWKSTDNARTITLNDMGLGVEHNFYAKYIGNKKCSPSSSKIVTVLVEDTRRVTPTITINGTSQYDKNTEITQTVSVTSDVFDTDGVVLDVYYDNTLVAGNIVVEDETASFTISDCGDDGLHTIRVESHITEHFLTQTVTKNISIGYKMFMDISHDPIFQNMILYVTVRVRDWLNNPIIGKSVTVNSDGFNVTGTTSSYGENTFMERYDNPYFNESYNVLPVEDTFIVTCGDSQISKTVIVENPSNLKITSSTPRLYKNESSVLTVSADYIVENTPVTLTGFVFDTLYTNSAGVVTKTVTGTGGGTKTVTAKMGTLTKTLTLEDYYQYWGLQGDLHNREYLLDNNTQMLDFNNYFTVRVPNGNNINIEQYTPAYTLFALLNIPTNINYELVLSGVASSKNMAIHYVNNIIDNGDGTITWGDGATITFNNATSHSNETWKIQRIEGTVSVYKNDSLIESFENQEKYAPALFLGNNSTSANGFDVNFTSLSIKGGV